MKQSPQQDRGGKHGFSSCTMSSMGSFPLSVSEHILNHGLRGKMWTEECKQPFQVLALDRSMFPIYCGESGNSTVAEMLLQLQKPQ